MSMIELIEAAKVIQNFCECHSCEDCPAWHLKKLGFNCEFESTPDTWGDWIKEWEDWIKEIEKI